MGRDLTGVIVFAKDEDSAYKKGRKIFRKLVKEEALWFFFTYDDFDKDAGHYCHEFPAMAKLSRAMLVDKKTNNKGYQFVRWIIRGDEANNYKSEELLNAITALSQIKTKDRASKFLASGRLTFIDSKGKQKTSDSIKRTLGHIGNLDKFLTGIYAQYWGKVTQYTHLDWVLNRDPKDFDDCKKVAKIMADPEYKIWVVPALSKT